MEVSTNFTQRKNLSSVTVGGPNKEKKKKKQDKEEKKVKTEKFWDNSGVECLLCTVMQNATVHRRLMCMQLCIIVSFHCKY